MSGFVGIDVAAKTFDIVVRIDGKANKVEQFSQTPDGHAAVRKLQKLAPELGSSWKRPGFITSTLLWHWLKRIYRCR
jgi:hypothetical protein